MGTPRRTFMRFVGSKVSRSLALLTIAASLLACSDKSVDTKENHSPSTPILLLPLDGAVAMPTTATLTWEAADPEGDSLNFEIYFEVENPPNVLAIASQPTKSRVLSQLSQGVTYFWRVLAIDENGARSPLSAVSQFTVGSFMTGWRDRQPMPTSRISPASAVSGNRLYVLGGISDQGILDICETYDPTTENWTQVSSLPAPRAYACAVEHGGKIYVLGGESSLERLSIVESYDPEKDSWSQMAPLPSPRSRFGAVTYNDKIFTFGGYQSDGAIYEYDISTDQWQQIGTLPESRDGMSVTVYNGLFYIIGGSRPDNFWLTDVTVYDPNTGAFSSRASMPTARRDHRASLIGGKIYVTGGMNAIDNRHTFFSSVEVYDIASETWLTRSRMKNARHDHAAGVIVGKLYIAGGLTDETPGILNSLEEYDPILDP